MQVEIRPRNTYEQSNDSSYSHLHGASPVLKKVQERWSNGRSIDCPKDLKNKVLDESQHSQGKARYGVFSKSGTSKPKSSSRKTNTAERWEFGRHKVFTIHKATPKKTKSAILIQKMMRGWWQRVKFQLVWLQHRLDTRDSRKKASLERVAQKTEKRKAALKEKMEAKAKKELEKVTIEQKTAEEGQQIISYLRRENKKLRSKNEKIHQASGVLKHNNDRLESVNKTTEDGFSTLNAHAKTIKETHDKLQVVVPKYKLGIEKLEEAVEERRQYCLAEHTIKLLYVKLLGKVVEMVEDSVNDTKLVDEIVGYCLEVEGEDNRLELPKKLESFLDKPLDNDSDDDSENYDEFTVATLEE